MPNHTENNYTHREVQLNVSIDSRITHTHTHCESCSSPVSDWRYILADNLPNHCPSDTWGHHLKKRSPGHRHKIKVYAVHE